MLLPVDCSVKSIYICAGTQLLRIVSYIQTSELPYTKGAIIYLFSIFSSPEPKAQGELILIPVEPSSVCLAVCQHFQTRIVLSGEDVFEEDLSKSPTLGRGKRALKRI